MAKEGGKLLIKYRDPVAASFSSKDVVMNVQTGTLFYKRNRKLYALRGTPDNFDLVVFPGQSTNQQILINDNSDTQIMAGTDQFRFKLASATCGCANYFYIGAETLTHFSGSVRVGEHLPSTCDLLDGEINPALKIYGNVSAVANTSAGMPGHITASGNIWSQDNVIASNDLYGTNAHIHDSLIHRGNTDTRLTFGTDIIQLITDGNIVTTINSSSLTVNAPYDLYIPGTDSAPTSSTSVLVLDNTTGQVYKTGSYFVPTTFKSTGQRDGDSAITGSLTVTSHLTASANISASGLLYASASSANGNLYQTVMMNTASGEFFYTGSYGGDGTGTGTNITVSDEGTSLTTAATSFNFVGNAVIASESSDAVTVTINAITKSLWYDGQPHYISSSDNVFIDKKLGIGNQWYGQTVGSNSPTHEIHLTASGDEISVGYTGPEGHTWSTGTTLGGDNLFSINDIGDSGAGQSSGNRVITIYGTGSGLPGNYSLRAPEAISIAAALKSGGTLPNPTFIGATDTTIPAVMIDPVGISSSLAKLHINTNSADDGLLYNGLCVGPYYNPLPSNTQNSGSGLFLHIGSKDGYTAKDGYAPRITAKTEAGNVWHTTRALVICGEVDRSVGYGSGALGSKGLSSGMEFITKDVSGMAFSASLAGDGIHGAPATQSMDEVYGTGSQFIIGGQTIPRVSFSSTNYLYTFLNDTMPLLAMEATGKIGIGNFQIGGLYSPQANLHIAARSGSDADILLQTRHQSSPTTIPRLKLEMGGHSNGNKLYNPTKYSGEFYVRNEYTSGSFYDFQKTNSTVIESRGISEGLSEHHYPFDIRGAAKNNFKANNIQFVVGGDDAPYNSNITSNMIGSGSSSEYISTNNNGRAAITIEGISDFRRFGEVGIGVENPSSSLHVTRSVQADNFRTTNPVDIPITGTNPSIQTIYSSNQLIGSNTQFTSDFKVGDAIKVKGRSIIISSHRAYALSGSLTSASSTVNNSYGTFVFSRQTILSDDMILISSGACGSTLPLNDQTGSFHQITGINNGGGSHPVGDREIDFTPAYTGTTTSSAYLVHRVNPHHYQIATVDSIYSDTSMSISQNWEGITWSGSTGYKEEVLFQVKTADYNPVFTINAHGDITGSGTASFGYLDIGSVSTINSSISSSYALTASYIDSSNLDTFKQTGQRSGDSAITGSLIVTGNITAQEFHTEFISSSIIFESGSTQFGNSSDDTHTFSGSINVKDEGHITASGNISASGHLFISASNIDTPNLLFYNTVGGELTYASTSSFLSGLLSSSAQIADDISGSLGANATLIRSLTAAGISGSWQGQNFISASQTFLSTGQRSGDSAITGSLEVVGAITASGNVSASGNVIGANVFLPGGGKVSFDDSLDGSDQFIAGNDNNLTIDGDNIIKLRADHTIEFQDTSNNTQVTVNPIAGHITASGNISSSGQIEALEAEIYTNLNVGTTLEVGGLSTLQETTTTNIFADGHITASGNISASGTLNAGLAAATPTNIAYYNTTNGLFTYGPALGAAAANTVSSSQQIQDYGTFLLNTTDTFTGQLKVEGSISSSGNIYLGNADTSSSLIFGGRTGDSAKIYTKLTGTSQQELIIQTTDNSDDNIRIQTDGWNDANSGSIYLTGEDVNISGRATTGQYVKFDGDNARVGIGTNSPGEKLEVVGNISASGTLSAGLAQASGSHITYYNTSSGLFTYESNPSATGTMNGFYLDGDSGPTQTITDSNTVSIFGGTGITTIAGNTGDKVTINCDITNNNQLTNGSNYSTTTGTMTGVSSGNNINITGPSNSPSIAFSPGGNSYGIYFNNSSQNLGTPTTNFRYQSSNLYVGGDVIAFASDKRLKENIVVISDPIEKIKQLRGVYYDWKDSTLDLGFETKRQHNEIGLIAQELEKVIPQAITRAPFDNIDNPKLYVSGSRIDGETEPYKTIKMDKVIPLLIEGIKDQQKQIDELKELVTKLINK